MDRPVEQALLLTFPGPRGACHVGGDGRWTGGRETRLMTIHERESGRSMHAWPCMPMLDEPDPDRRER
jgi:hypothetical protein